MNHILKDCSSFSLFFFKESRYHIIYHNIIPEKTIYAGSIIFKESLYVSALIACSQLRVNIPISTVSVKKTNFDILNIVHIIIIL